MDPAAAAAAAKTPQAIDMTSQHSSGSGGTTVARAQQQQRQALAQAAAAATAAAACGLSVPFVPRFDFSGLGDPLQEARCVCLAKAAAERRPVLKQLEYWGPGLLRFRRKQCVPAVGDRRLRLWHACGMVGA